MYLFSDYEIVVVTGDRALAGTDSNVFITIYGKTGATHKIHLKRKTDHTFQQGHSDTFKIHGNCVGPMQRIRIEHDNKGVAPGWFLERVSKPLLGPQISGRNGEKSISQLKHMLWVVKTDP